MKVLAISGSPHRNGTISSLVKEALSGAKIAGHEGNYYNLYDLKIKPCKGCMSCRDQESKCVIEDDMKMLHREINQSDVLILGSPTYWANISSQTKAFFDRSVSVFINNSGKIPKPLQKGKKAILITSCGVSRLINLFTGQTRGSFRAMKKVLKKGAGYKIEKKFKKTNLYSEKSVNENDIATIQNIGKSL